MPMSAEGVGVIYTPQERLPPICKITLRTQNSFCLLLNTDNEKSIRKGRAQQLDPLGWLWFLQI